MNAEEGEEQSNIEEPPIIQATQGEGDSNSTCTICMEEWTIGSEHRLCCLKCGHLFGRVCIERWIKEKGANAKCPTCNKPSRRSDIRDLWCKTLKATDDTEINQLKQLLENERKIRKTDSATIFHQNLKLEMLHEDVQKLKKQLVERDEKIARYERLINRVQTSIRQQRLAAPNGDSSVVVEMDLVSPLETEVIDLEQIEVEPKELKGMFHFNEKVESSSTGGCRSFALCPSSCLILVAQTAPAGTSNVFSGYGLRKYSTLDTNIREFIPLHSKMITSIQVKPIGDLVLTSSHDKKVRLTSIMNNTCVQSYTCEHLPASVSWSAHRDQQFYVASSNCYVTLYDIRNTSEYIYQTSQKVAATGLLSATSTASSSTEGLNGLLVNDFKGSQFLEISESSNYDLETIDRSEEHLTTYQLPFEGRMGSVDFDKQSEMALVSIRRSPLTPNCQHNLVKLKKVCNENDGSTRVECERVRTFLGGTSEELLSQSRILRHPTLSESVLVCASDQDARGIKLWDSSDNTEYQTIRTDIYTRDVIMYSPENSNQHILYLLSDNGLSIYRWDYA